MGDIIMQHTIVQIEMRKPDADKIRSFARENGLARQAFYRKCLQTGYEELKKYQMDSEGNV